MDDLIALQAELLASLNECKQQLLRSEERRKESEARAEASQKKEKEGMGGSYHRCLVTDFF
jgi:heme exporter protein D